MFNRFKTAILLTSQTIPLLEARPASAHMLIVNPFTPALLSTHPPMEERIRRLEAAASQH